MKLADRKTPLTDAFEAEHRHVDHMTAAYAAFEYCRSLEQRLAHAVEALEFFIERVESGTARSVTTYAKFKAILSEIEAAGREG